MKQRILGDSGVPREFPDKLTKEQFERVRNFFSIGITPSGMRCSVASSAVILTYFMTNIASGSIRVDQNGFKVQYADSKEDIRAIPDRESHHEHISWGEFLRGEISVAQAITLDALFGFHSMVALRFERDGENVQKHLARAAVSRRYDDLERIHAVMKQLQTSMCKFLRA